MSQELASLRQNILDDLGEAGKEAALEGIRSVLTEENTDYMIGMLNGVIAGALPWYLRWVPIGAVLDKLLPDALLDVFEKLLG